MSEKAQYRNRDDTDVAVLNALVNRSEEGMTIFELRAEVDADIDAIESSLTALKQDNLIVIEQNSRNGSQAVIKPADRVLPQESQPDSRSFLEKLRDRLPF